MIGLTSEIFDALNRTIILSIRRGEFYACPFAWRKISSTPETERAPLNGVFIVDLDAYLNDGTKLWVSRGHQPGKSLGLKERLESLDGLSHSNWLTRLEQSAK